MSHFKYSEFLILGGHRADLPLTAELADKILAHIEQLNAVRSAINMPVTITSAYRPVWWERTRGRSGESEHTFVGMGAVDLACGDMELLIDALGMSKYIRICYYPGSNFVHCDFKFPERGQRFFIGPQWEQVEQAKLFKKNESHE